MDQGDLLSDLLTLSSPHCVLAGGVLAAGSWAFQTGAPGLLQVFTVVRGRATVSGNGRTVHDLRPGDVFAVPGHEPLVFRSDPDVVPLDADALYAERGEPVLQLGGEGDDFLLVGCHVGFGLHASDLLLEGWSSAVHFHEDHPASHPSRAVLDALCDEATHAARAGATYARDQLVRLLLLYVLRARVDVGSLIPGWVSLLGDGDLAPAVRLIHRMPERAWGVAELARACGMSRTSFAVRFRDVAGVPPSSYLRAWRMRIARRRLRDGGSIGEVGESLGYRSESAFSTAFKRVVGVSPTAWRGQLDSGGGRSPIAS